MKKDFNLKLTATLVSLFIAIIMCALSNVSKYCLFFSLIFLAISALLFVWYKKSDLDKKIKDLQEIVDVKNNAEIERKKLKEKKKEHRKLTISFTLAAIMLIVIAFMIL